MVILSLSLLPLRAYEPYTLWFSHTHHLRVLGLKVDREQRRIVADVSVANVAYEKDFFLFVDGMSFPFYHDLSLRGQRGIAEYRGKDHDDRDLFHLELPLIDGLSVESGITLMLVMPGGSERIDQLLRSPDAIVRGHGVYYSSNRINSEFLFPNRDNGCAHALRVSP